MIVTGLFNIYALIFGIFGGVLATLDLRRPPRPLLRHPAQQRLHHRPLGQRRQNHPVRRDHRDRLLLQGHDRQSGGAEGVGRAVNQGVVISFLGIFAFNYVFTQTLLATHPEISVIK